VSAIAVDPTGSRVLTGGYDYSVRMFDFQGMNSSLRSFRQLEPSEGHQLRALSWSPTADQFIAVTGSAQAKIYDRDGFTLGEFVKGDMYIRDLKNTKGHISGLTGGHWHPKDRETALTSSEDGSIRIWDVTNFKSQKQVNNASMLPGYFYQFSISKLLNI
jgi:WD40 repeat protein